MGIEPITLLTQRCIRIPVAPAKKKVGNERPTHKLLHQTLTLAHINDQSFI